MPQTVHSLAPVRSPHFDEAVSAIAGVKSVRPSLPPPRTLCNRRCLCLSVCPLAAVRKNFRTDLHEIFREGWQWANEQMTKFWCMDTDPHRDTGKTCLGGGMHCPSAASSPSVPPSFKGRFPGKPGFAGSPDVFFIQLFQNTAPLATSGTGFYRLYALSVSSLI